MSNRNFLPEYWEAPGITISFLKAHTGSAFRVDGGVAQCVGKTQLIVIPDSPIVRIPEFLQEGRRLRIFPTLGGKTKTSKKTWVTCEDLSQSDSYEERRGRREGLEFGPILYEEACELMDRWAIWSKSRRYITVTGHYAQMLVQPDITFVGARLKGEVVAAYGFTGKVICFLKHVPGYNWLAGAVWSHCLKQMGEGVNCGDTAEFLKKRLGLKPLRLFQAQIKTEAYAEPIDLGHTFRRYDWREAALCSRLRKLDPDANWDRLNPPPSPHPGDKEIKWGEAGQGQCLDLNLRQGTLLYLKEHRQSLRLWSQSYQSLVYTDSTKSRDRRNEKSYLSYTKGVAQNWEEYKDEVSNFWADLGFGLKQTQEYQRAVKFYFSKN